MIAIEVLRKEIRAQKEKSIELCGILEQTEDKKTRVLKDIQTTDETIKDLEATVFVLKQMEGNDGS